MNDAPEITEKEIKKAKLFRTLRIVWMILIPLFALIILYRLYNNANGKDDLSGILSPLGMIFLGLSSIVGERRRTLKIILLAVAMILVFSGLIVLFVY